MCLKGGEVVKRFLRAHKENWPSHLVNMCFCVFDIFCSRSPHDNFCKYILNYNQRLQ